MMVELRHTFAAAAISATLALAACGDAAKTGSGAAKRDSAPAAASTPTPAGPVALGGEVARTGRTVAVQLVTDEAGNRFEPDTVTARPGDVVRFTMVTGMHNVHFAADRNPGVRGLPGPSELLTVPGQMKEYVVGLDPGAYVFQCDPHVALGMLGTLLVAK